MLCIPSFSFYLPQIHVLLPPKHFNVLPSFFHHICKFLSNVQTLQLSFCVVTDARVAVQHCQEVKSAITDEHCLRYKYLATLYHALLTASWICNQVLHQLMEHKDRLCVFLNVILHLATVFCDESILLCDLCQTNRTALHSSWTNIECMSFFPLVYLWAPHPLCRYVDPKHYL